MTPRTYASPEAFKQALEQRLRSSAKTGADAHHDPQKFDPEFDPGIGADVGVAWSATKKRGPGIAARALKSASANAGRMRV